MAAPVSMNVGLVVPVRNGVSGGLATQLRDLGEEWKSDERIGRRVLYSPPQIQVPCDEASFETRHVTGWTSRLRKSEIARALERDGIDVVLCLSARPLDAGRTPVVQMVRNVEPLQPAKYRMSTLWRLRLAILRRETLKACANADRIVCVSRYVKDRLVALGVRASRMDVVYHGLGSRPESSTRPEACRDPSEAFIFSAGSIVPYRGYEDLIQAIASPSSRRAPLPRVVLAGGGSGWAKDYAMQLRALAARLGVEPRITWTGPLRASEMLWCLRQAAVVVQTSRAESFSLFQVEALREGCAVIATRQPPMPEILGTAAKYYEGGNPVDLARVLRETLGEGREVVERRRKAAILRAGEYSMKRDAAELLRTLAVCRNSAEERSSR